MENVKITSLAIPLLKRLKSLQDLAGTAPWPSCWHEIRWHEIRAMVKESIPRGSQNEHTVSAGQEPGVTPGNSEPTSFVFSQKPSRLCILGSLYIELEAQEKVSHLPEGSHSQSAAEGRSESKSCHPSPPDQVGDKKAL